jgi:hypothetical protein|eukprot:COSAG06_NODE_18979_length_859_cov_0.948684_2_plen_112_part_00
MYYKTIILSRQARDKHRDCTPKTTTVFSGGSPAHPFNTTAGTKIGDFGASPNKLAAGKNIYLVPKGANVTLDFGAAATLTTLKVRKNADLLRRFYATKNDHHSTKAGSGQT